MSTVGILSAMDFWEEWLDHLEVSFEDFETQLMGSFMFGYAEALSRAGLRTAFMLFTRRETGRHRAVHAPTGAVIRYLPPLRAYSQLEGLLARPRLRERWAAKAVGRHVLPYLATSVGPLARALREERCDAVIHQEYECARYDTVASLARVLGIPIFPSFHAGFPRSRLERLLHPITVPLATGLIVSSRAEFERVQSKYGISEARIARIPNPIDLDVWRPEDRAQARAALAIPAEATVVVWHGALYLEIKGLDLLIDAWGRLTGDRPDRDLRLLLVGGGIDGPELARRIRASGAPGIQFVNCFVHDRSELRKHLSAADLYAFASRTEGYPNALLEAMACGLPLVATAIAGVPDIVGEGPSAGGLLVPPEDVGLLVEAMARLIDDPELRTRLGRQARLRVDERFSLDTVGAQLRDFLAIPARHEPVASS